MPTKSFLAVCLTLLLGATTAPTIHINHPALKQLGWQLACRASTFNHITTLEMIDQLHEMGFHHIELSPGQILSPQLPDVKISHQMTSDQVDLLLEKLKSVKMDIVSYGPIALADQADASLAFEFGKKLKLKNIVIVDPTDDSLHMLDQLAAESGINVAIESTPDTDAISKSLEGCSTHIGVCFDTAVWRANSVMAIKLLGSRIIQMHLSDVDAQGKQLPLGSGKIDLPGILQQLKSQDFKGVFAIGYSSEDQNEVIESFAKSINAFADETGKLAPDAK